MTPRDVMTKCEAASLAPVSASAYLREIAGHPALPPDEIGIHCFEKELS
jgi:hypothetical protein